MVMCKIVTHSDRCKIERKENNVGSCQLLYLLVLISASFLGQIKLWFNSLKYHSAEVVLHPQNVIQTNAVRMNVTRARQRKLFFANFKVDFRRRLEFCCICQSLQKSFKRFKRRQIIFFVVVVTILTALLLRKHRMIPNEVKRNSNQIEFQLN